MNGTDLSRENGRVMCKDGQGSIGAGCGERNGLRVQNYTEGGFLRHWMQAIIKALVREMVKNGSF